MRLSVTLDPEFVEEAVQLSRVRSKRQTIETALEELIRFHQPEGIIASAGGVYLPLQLTICGKCMPQAYAGPRVSHALAHGPRWAGSDSFLSGT